MNLIKVTTMVAWISLAVTLNVKAKEGHDIVYGNVASVLITTADSKILEGTIVGGALGLAIGDSALYTLNGAALGFAITSIMEGDRRVFLYTINVDGNERKIAMQEGGIGEGRCVAIETQGKHTNVRGVSSAFCQYKGHQVLTSTEVVTQQQFQAQQCKEARELVLTAKNDKEIDHALVKVRALCE
ncbi:hypothetical protein [Colwellia psychrerythraea]|uniref:Uncharacterized protein n=1 Tax=Colwellia psychrerythraea (strain 34H / ATCC BAA-681) TaxID=167879 RepID=Q481X1_COLP3|nr:hypothetical protein [Colwellia psychrerythraea]AAZ24799.1 hypothetical protein CPS_2431 [Colwellia psychrerythraea 34H]